MDLTALVLATRALPKNRAIRGSIAFVIGATLFDIVTAREMDRTTDKTLPIAAG